MNAKFRPLLICLFSFSLLSSPAHAVVKAGASCNSKGQVKTVSGYKYTCIKSGKKLIWNKGVVVAKPTLTATSTSADAPAVSPTNTPATTSTLETEVTGPTCSRNKNALRNC